MLDYGWGIGSDGLLLLEAGYQVEFADFDNPSDGVPPPAPPSSESLDAPVHDLDAGVPGGFDAAYSFDVIEHVPDPYAFLGELERRAGLVEVNLLEFDPNEQELHYRLPIGALLRHTARRQLEHYEILHGTSHLVIYRPDPAGMSRRLQNVGSLVLGRLRRRSA